MKNTILNNLADIFTVTIIALINLIFTQLPLINLLSYESSSLNGVLLSFLSGFYFLKYKYNRNTRSILVSLALFSIIPVIILTFSTTLCQNCPLDDGIYFYLIITLPSNIVGLSISFFADIFSKKHRYLIFIFLWLVVLFSFIPELYFYPQIYFYNPIFGYYPGVIYDQSIEITKELINYRVINLIIASIIIFISFNKYFYKKNKHYVIIILSVLLFVQISFNSVLGFSTTLYSVKSELKGELFTDHFNIIFPDSLSEKQKKVLELDHEYYYFSNSKILGYHPESKITSIIYGTGTQKKQLFGSANADVAKPWLNQIYLNLDNYQNSLKHEIAHIFSAKYGVGPFKIPSNFNPGIIEGFAMAVENNYDDFDIDYLASLAYQNNYKVSLTSLFSDFSFFSNASSISYIYAGSFFKYLAANYGWEKVNLVYSGSSFEEVYNSTLPELEKNYYDYLKKNPEEDNPDIANYYFGRKPLIQLSCARVTAKALTEAQNLLKDEKYKESVAKYLEIYNYSNSYAALVGYAVSSLSVENEDKVITLLENEIKKFEGTAYLYYLEYLLADLNALNNDSIEAAKYYKSIIIQNPNIRYLRNASVKLDLLSKSDSTLINYIKAKGGKSIILTKNILENPNDYALQLLTEFSYSEKESYKNKIDFIENVMRDSEYLSYTYFEISNYAYKNLDFSTSLKYAKKALLSADFRRIPIIDEQISKLNWILNQNLEF